MKLVIVHYHLRPGGIRRVIELATPHLARQFNGALETVALACGEANDRKWNVCFRERLAGTQVEFFVEPAFNYLSEQRRSAHAVTQLIRAAFAKMFAAASAKNCLVWAHNLGIGRNLLLTRELTRICAAQGIPLVAHHHDEDFCRIEIVARFVEQRFRIGFQHAWMKRARICAPQA